MTDLRQAAQQALEALDQLTDDVDGTGLNTKPSFDAALLAITALKAALEQQAEPTCPNCKAAVLYECVACSSNNYPPQQQAEPVAVERWLWIFEDRHGDRYTHKNLFYTADEAAESARICGVKAIKKIDSSKVTQQAEPVQERITHITWDERGVRTVNGIPDDAPQRQWVGLTDEDCKRMSAGDKLVAMWAEAKLKERNND